MKKHTFLTEHKGLYSNTPRDIVAVWNEEEHRELLEEEKTVQYNHDFMMQTTIKKYGQQSATLPDWIDPAQYAASSTLQIKLKYFTGFGGSIEWPENYFKKLSQLDEVSEYAAIKLLNTKNFRSDFRQSLHDQLVEWIEAEENQYPSPFSRKQWQCILNKYITREAKNTSTHIYRERSKLIYA